MTFGARTLALLLPLVPSAALASGPVEMVAGVYVDPADPQRLLVRYDNTGSKTGVLYSDDGGQSFSLVCTAAVAASALRGLGDGLPDMLVNEIRSGLSRNRRALFTHDGHTLLATTSGLYLDDGQGCSFADVNEVTGLWISGVDTQVSGSGATYFITNGSTEAAGEGLWKRSSDGAMVQLAARSTPPPGQTWSASDLLVASDGSANTPRLYVTSLRFEAGGDGLGVFVMRTDDEGTSWDEFELPGVPEQAGFELLAVDPTDKHRVLAMFERSKEGGDWESNKDTVLLSNDGGQTFAPLFEVAALSGVLFEPDGTLWVSDLGTDAGDPAMSIGLYKLAPGLATPPEHVIADEAIGCIAKAPTGSDLYLCHLFDFGVFDPVMGSFVELAAMTSVNTIRSCEGQDVVSDCRDQLCDPGWCGPGHFASAPLCTAYDEKYCGPRADYWNEDAGESVEDAGTQADSGADADVDAGVAPEKEPDCSVGPVRSGRTPWAPIGFGLALAWLGVRARRRKD